MQSLTMDLMTEAGDVFTAAYQQVQNNFVGKSKNDVAIFVTAFVLSEKPYLLVTEEGLTRAISMVFEDETVRDFIQTLSFVFFARWGTTNDRYSVLVESLAAGVSYDVVTASMEINGVPSVVRERLASYPDAKELLMSNPWLVILIMMSLYITIDHPQTTRTTPTVPPQ